MKKLFLKSALYVFLIICCLELSVRALHLYTEVPTRYIDNHGVEKSLPNQKGFAVTGNRRQNYSEYNINNSGFNSFREFTPTKEGVEIAIIGDSFIEGMHQNYFNSIGKKVEDRLNDVEVYEYGYAGYDLSNQLHLMNAYKEDFEFIDHIIIYLKYESDLINDTYTPNKERIELLESPLFKIRDQFKLLSYTTKIGVMDPIKNLALILTKKNKPAIFPSNVSIKQATIDLKLLENFKSLTSKYSFDKNKVSFLLNSEETSTTFLNYCHDNNYQVIDYSKVFKESDKSPTLIYDQHWNDHGRDLVATVIADYFKNRINL